MRFLLLKLCEMMFLIIRDNLHNVYWNDKSKKCILYSGTILITHYQTFKGDVEIQFIPYHTAEETIVAVIQGDSEFIQLCCRGKVEGTCRKGNMSDRDTLRSTICPREGCSRMSTLQSHAEWQCCTNDESPCMYKMDAICGTSEQADVHSDHVHQTCFDLNVTSMCQHVLMEVA